MYIATGIIIGGSILSNILTNLKIKCIFNIQLGLFVSVLGAIFLLIATILFDCYSNKIESQNKIDFEKRLSGRDKIIEENNETLLLTNRFHAQIDNPIKSIFFILDLGATQLNNNFSDFSCVIRFINLDITALFRTIHFKNPRSENAEFFEARVVKGNNLNESPFVMVANSSFKNISELYLDLMLMIELLPDNFSIRDLNEQPFYFYLSEKQTTLVKGIKLNVNNWDIFNKKEDSIHWRELKQDWLPDRKDLKVFYQVYQTRFYDYNTIQFFQEGFSYYEIVHSNIDSRSILSQNDIDKIFQNINDEEGTLIFDIDNKWRVKNDALIEYLPFTSKNGVSIRVFRDSDNLLKLNLSYKYANNLMLKCRYPENFGDSREFHTLSLIWSKIKVTFFIDGKEVDEIKIQK